MLLHLNGNREELLALMVTEPWKSLQDIKQYGYCFSQCQSSISVVDVLDSMFLPHCGHSLQSRSVSLPPSVSPPVLCPMLCQNGGVCIQKDRCLCPPTFTGKFCHIPVATPSTNDIEKPPRIPSVLASQQLLTQSEYILPLQSQQQSHSQPSGGKCDKAGLICGSGGI